MRRQMRESFGKFIETLKPGQPALCVEVGVSFGDNAVNMLSYLPSAQFMLVDSYDVNNSTFQFDDGKIFTPKEREAFINEVKQRLAVFGDRAKLFIEDSVVASKRFKDNSLDYVYIDAQHEEGWVKRDIEAWWPKIKLGGVISGHDLSSHGEVIKAVEKMFGKEYEVLNIDWYKVKT